MKTKETEREGSWRKRKKQNKYRDGEAWSNIGSDTSRDRPTESAYIYLSALGYGEYPQFHILQTNRLCGDSYLTCSLQASRL